MKSSVGSLIEANNCSYFQAILLSVFLWVWTVFTAPQLLSSEDVTPHIQLMQLRVNLPSRHNQLLKKLDDVGLSFGVIFLVKIHDNLTAHFIFDAQNWRLNDARSQCASIMS